MCCQLCCRRCNHSSTSSNGRKSRSTTSATQTFNATALQHDNTINIRCKIPFATLECAQNSHSEVANGDVEVRPALTHASDGVRCGRSRELRVILPGSAFRFSSVWLCWLNFSGEAVASFSSVADFLVNSKYPPVGYIIETSKCSQL